MRKTNTDRAEEPALVQRVASEFPTLRNFDGVSDYIVNQTTPGG